MSLTYLTTDELSIRIKYTPSTIRCALKDSVLLEGRHYIRPFGGRKVLYIWENIEQDMLGEMASEDPLVIPMSNGDQAISKPPRTHIKQHDNGTNPQINGDSIRG